MDSKPLQVDAVSTLNRHPRGDQDSKPLQVDAVSTPNRHPIGNQDSKPLQVDAVLTLNRHPRGETVNLYRLMQSRHPIVIQEASRFPRDTAFSIYNYILAHLRHRDGKWHHEPPGNKCTVHLSISHLPTTYKYNLYYPPTEVTDVAVM
ncbi:hypothetical protein J6590_091923 [Homalodisca vitripennis]|nr:hypothetical protein J6590_091923 [Homalodisca vitripennis]